MLGLLLLPWPKASRGGEGLSGLHFHKVVPHWRKPGQEPFSLSSTEWQKFRTVGGQKMSPGSQSPLWQRQDRKSEFQKSPGCFHFKVLGLRVGASAASVKAQDEQGTVFRQCIPWLRWCHRRKQQLMLFMGSKWLQITRWAVLSSCRASYCFLTL